MWWQGLLRDFERHIGISICKSAKRPSNPSAVDKDRQTTRVKNENGRVGKWTDRCEKDNIPEEWNPFGARRRVEQNRPRVLSKRISRLGDQVEEMADLLPLETTHFHHFLAEFHPQPVHHEIRPVMIE